MMIEATFLIPKVAIDEVALFMFNILTVFHQKLICEKVQCFKVQFCVITQIVTCLKVRWYFGLGS